MATDPRLESYLSKLERVLAPFPASDRAEIVTEIKSHVLSALERDPQAQLDSILAALGEAETVANRYLMERGIKPARPPMSPVVKWVVIGFLGTVAMMVISTLVLFSKFSPILRVDGEKGNISILGGTIEISGEDETIRIGKSTITGGSEEKFKGEWEPAGRGFSFQFNNGKVEIGNSDDSKVNWHCRRKHGTDHPNVVENKSVGMLDLSSNKGVKCELNVPEKLKLSVRGNNGKIEVKEPHFNLDAFLSNGKVAFLPDEHSAYKYSISTVNGKFDDFTSSKDLTAYEIKIHVINGDVSRE